MLLVTFILAAVALWTALRLYTLRTTPITPVAPGDSSASEQNDIESCQVLVINLSSPSPSPSSSPQPPQCLLYAVHDQGSDDTQFLSINPQTSEVRLLGPLYANYNAESLEYDPQTGNLYTVTRSGPFSKQLMTVDKVTGALTTVGSVGSGEIRALSIDKSDFSLWAWQKGRGLIKIDKTSGATTTVLSSSLQIGGIAWDNSGEYLYAASSADSKLYRYTKASNNIQEYANNLPGGKNEALEMNSNNILLGGFHGAPNEMSIFAYDITEKKILLSGSLATQFNDIEGIAWPDNCGEIPPIDVEPIISQCLAITFYDTQFNSLDLTDISKMQEGEILRMAVSGSSTNGNIDKAKFVINGVPQTETTQKKPSTNEFYFDYVLPSDLSQLKVNAQVHHVTLGWF